MWPAGLDVWTEAPNILFMMQDQPQRPHPEALPRRHAPHRLGKALLAIPLVAAAGWLTYKSRGIPRNPPLPEALPGQRLSLETADGRLSYYRTGPSRPAETSAPPLLLVHSVNAAGSAYEVGPIFGPLAATRAVYALELPGFGFSERRRRLYTPQLMTSAVQAMAAQIKADHPGSRVDALALSLSSEFLARAAAEAPDTFGSLALVSPTGFDRREPRDGPPGSNRGMPALYKTFTGGPWSRGLFDLLTSRVSIRYFLEKTWGSKAIDEGLLEYDYLSTHQDGAQHAPYSFVSGYLFSRDISRIYDSLTHPVWMVHGTRGDFTDYRGKSRVEKRPNWTIDVFDTGALPHFEEPHRFNAQLRSFLAGMPADPTPCGPLDWTRDGATWPNRWASRFVEAAGLVWHVQVAGSGPVALLIHGTGASTHSWRDLMPLLARRFLVVAPDLPGHAFTQGAAPSRTSLPGMAAGVSALMARLGLAPSIVVGHSAGAAILVRLCLDKAITPEGIVSLNGALLPIGGVAGQVFSPLARVLARSSMASRLFARRAGDRGVVQRMIAQTGSRLDAAGLEFYTQLARNPMHTAGALSMMAGWDLVALERELPRLALPLLLAVGGRDQTIKPDDALEIRDLVPGSTIEYLRGLGHLAHEEKPALIAELIDRYVTLWGVADGAVTRDRSNMV